jgi:hypothetical protein
MKPGENRRKLTEYEQNLAARVFDVSLNGDKTVALQEQAFYNLN